METMPNYAGMAWRAVGDPRIFPFALCVFAFGLLAPTACAILCIRARSFGGRKATSDIMLIAFGCSLLGVVIFGLALAAVRAASPFRIGIVAHAGLMFYAGTVFIWGMVHPVSAVLSERLLDRIGGSTLPANKVNVELS